MKTQCSVELLESALAGKLRADDETSFYRHLDSCEQCSDALEQMAGGPAWCREAATLLTEDELDAAVLTRDEWSEIDFTVEHLEPADEPDVLGRLGGYDVLEIIGHGGMGVVLKAFDRELKRPVAIKVLAPHLARNSLARKRFAREAQAAAAVVHPHVLAIHQVQAGGRLPFLVMPLVAGESLAERLAAQGTLELKEVLRIGMQAADGLAAAHEQGLVHRDVKPANILLEKGVERAVLTDFGLARAADDVTLTRWGIVAGTPQYMSPEQARGEPLDGRSDLFSLGCVLYEMATGVSPFRTDSVMATMKRLVDDSPQAMASLNPELPPWFIAIVNRLLEKDPSRRYGSAKEVSELLENCLAHIQRPAAVPLPDGCKPTALHQPDRASGRFSKKPWASALRLIVLPLAILIAGVVIVLEWNKGTLTIESAADDVALRITQGDKVVDKLTVTRGANKVRIAAGNYLVEIDGQADGVAVKGGNVAITRGGTEIVKIVQSGAAKTDPALPWPAHPPRPSPDDFHGQAGPSRPSTDGFPPQDPNPPRRSTDDNPNQDPGTPTAPTAADTDGSKERRTEHPGFSETKVLVLSMGSSKFMLDLDSGNTMDPPAKTGRPEQGQMDVSTDQVQPYHYPKELIGYELQGREVEPSFWNATVAEVQRTLAGNIFPLKQMDLGPEKNPTYFFKTRDGAQGILQLLGLADEPKGIRLRYKTVLAKSAPETPSAVPKRLNYFTTGHSLTIACSADGKRIAVANANPTRILQTNGGSRVQGGWKPTADVIDAETGNVVVSLKLTTDDEDAILAATQRISHVEATALAFSPDGQLVAVGTSIGQVKLYSAKSGELFRILDDPARLEDKDTPENWKSLKRAMGSVASLAFSPDGTLLATCGESFRQFSDVFDGVQRLGRSDSVTGPGRLKLWEVKSGSLKHDLVGHGRVSAVAFSPDGIYLGSAGSWLASDGSGHGTGVLIWNTHTGAKHHTIAQEANGGTHALAFSPDNRKVAIGSWRYDKENDKSTMAVSLAHVRSGVSEWEQQLPGGAKLNAFSPDGNAVLVLAGQSIRFLDAGTGTVKREVKSENLSRGGRLADFAVASKANRLVIGAVDGEEGSVEVWDFPDAKAAAKPKHVRHFPTGAEPQSIAYSADGKLIALAFGELRQPMAPNWKRSAGILDTETGTVVPLELSTTEEDALLAATEGLGHREPLAFSPEGSVVAVGTSLGQVKLFNPRTGKLIRSLDDEKAKLADTETPEKFKSLKRALGSVASLAFSPDGSLLATCGSSFADTADLFDRIERSRLPVTDAGRLKVWDVKTGTLKHDLVGHSQAYAVAFSADGTILASAGKWADGSDHGNGVIIWNPETGAKVRVMVIDANGGPHAMAFSPTKKLLAIASLNFDKENDTRATKLSVAYPQSGITEWVQTIPGWAIPAFTPDGNTVAVLREGNTIRFVDAQTGQSKYELAAPDSPSAQRWRDLAIPLKANLLAVGGVEMENRGFVTVWSLESASAGSPLQ